VSYPGTVESVNFRGERTECQSNCAEFISRAIPNSLATPPKRDRKKTPKRSPPKTATLESTGVKARADGQLTVFTIGHSTHPIEEFIALLKHYGIEQLVDVRTVPKSRHVPQFNSDALAASLGKEGIGYVHLKALGGLRHAKKDSVNMGWRNASFRGYADYMSNEDFAQGIDRLIELAKAKRTVIMCAEAVPWRCHRSLIGDALLVRGIAAEDIMSATSIRPHKLTDFAKVDGQQITYPADKNLELFSGAESKAQ
jgi:hypothetical protein